MAHDLVVAMVMMMAMITYNVLVFVFILEGAMFCFVYDTFGILYVHICSHVYVVQYNLEGAMFSFVYDTFGILYVHICSHVYVVH